MKAIMPGGVAVPAEDILKWAEESDSQAAHYLPNEVARLETVYRKHAPEIEPRSRRKRALRMALELAGFKVTGVEGDATDLRILALSQGLADKDFAVVEMNGEPMLRLGSKALRRLAAEEGDSQAVH
jgi:hypothetical protein